MLHEFLTTHRTTLIARCSAKAERRAPPSKGGTAEPEHGVPIFVDQLAKALRLGAASSMLESPQVFGRSGGEMPDISDIGKARLAILDDHGRA